jgi:hypothetical protein
MHHASFSFCHVLLLIRKAAVAPGGLLRVGHMKSGYLIRTEYIRLAGQPRLTASPRKFGSVDTHCILGRPRRCMLSREEMLLLA